MQDQSTSFAVMLRATFDGAPLTAIEYAGKPAWIASDVGRAIGLADHRDAARRLRERKGKEGVHWRDLTPAELADAKGMGLLVPHVRTATLVLEPGLYWLAMTADTEPADRFRDWLAEDHLPALRRGPVAPIPEAPKQLTATPREQVSALIQSGFHLGAHFGSELLAAEVKIAKGHERAMRAEVREFQRQMKAAAKRENDAAWAVIRAAKAARRVKQAELREKARARFGL